MIVPIEIVIGSWFAEDQHTELGADPYF